MPKIADAFVEVTARTGKYIANIIKAQRITASFGQSATKSLKRVTIGLAAVTAAAAAAAIVIGIKLTRALVRMGRSVVKTAIKYDKLKIGMIAITGSAAKTEKQLIRLRKLALAPGLGFEQAIRGSIALQAAGVSAALAERSLSAFGNAIAAAGRGPEVLGRVNLQLSQIAAKTSGFGRDLLVIREAVPAIGPIMAKAFADKPLEDLSLSGQALIKILVEGLEGLGKVGDSVGNNIVNLEQSFDLLKNSIGKKLLEATKTATGGLTEIIDKLTFVIDHYEKYRDEAAKVFREVGIIALKITGEMVLGMAKIVSKIAGIVWVPLKFEIIRTMQDIKDEAGIGIEKVLGVFREAFGGDGEITRLQIESIKRSRVAWDVWFNTIRNADVDTAIREGLAGIEADFNATFATVMNLVGEANTVLDGFASNVRSSFAELDKAIEDSFAKSPVIDLAAAFKTFGIVIEANKKAFASFGGVIKTNITAAEEAIFKAKLVAKELADATRKAMEEAAKAVTDVLQPAFENLFENLFSGNTKSLWEQFWADLKRIAIRQISQIAAAQVLSGLFGGGPASSKGGGGFGSFLSSFAPLLTAINPAVGGLAAAGGFLAGKLEQPKTIQNNFFQTDFANLDPTRIQKTVSQTILPSLEEERTDGR